MSISWTEQVFCSSIIDFTLIRIDGASYLNGYCSLMVFGMFLMFFIKWKTCFFTVFICKIMFLTSTVLVYRCIQGSVPSYLKSYIFPVSDTAYRRRLRSASSGDLVVPATRRLTMGDRACLPVAPASAWNKFPDSVRQSSSLDVFKRLLKTHLFSLSFN